MPGPVAPSVTLATCRSRSARWSADDTRAQTTVEPQEGAAAGPPITISLPAWYAGTGSLLALNQRNAVTYEMPCAHAPFFKFMTTTLAD
jgi:hypothetical protein